MVEANVAFAPREPVETEEVPVEEAAVAALLVGVADAPLRRRACCATAFVERDDEEIILGFCCDKMRVMEVSTSLSYRRVWTEWWR